MKSIPLIIVLLILSLPALGQNWASIGRFNNAPDIVWYDSVDNRMYVAGTYTWFDSSSIRGFGYIQGDSVIGLGCGFEVDCSIYLGPNTHVPYVRGLARYQGDLYATGWFEKAGGVKVNGIAKWGGNDWVAIGSGFTRSTSTNAGVGNGLKVIGNDLYVFGMFDSINGVAANSLARFDGTSWEGVFDLPRFDSSPNGIFDVQWYKGEFYVGGTFNQFGSHPPIAALVKWDGSNWVAVGNGFSGTAPSVGQLLIYQDKLIVAGHFNKYQNPGSIHGNGIASFDGYSWDTLRGGLQYHMPGGAVGDIAVYNDELYVVGGFDSVGGVPAKNIAKWNGERWCGVWDPNDFLLRSVGFYNDTMFVTVNYGGIGGMDSISKFAKWVGRDFGDSCQLVGIEPPSASEGGISLYPNPADAYFELKLPSGIHDCRLKIFDVTGREVLGEMIYSSGQVDIAHLSKGLYLAEVSAKGRRQVIKLLKE